MDELTDEDRHALAVLATRQYLGTESEAAAVTDPAAGWVACGALVRLIGAQLIEARPPYRLTRPGRDAIPGEIPDPAIVHEIQGRWATA